MISWLKERPLFILFFVALSTFFAHLSILPVSIMEARNFITSREMLTEGHWLLTTMNNLPRYQKPPLPSWIGSMFGALIGENSVLAYRLPTSLMALLTVVCLYALVKLISGNLKLATISALVFCTSFYTIAIQREGPTDMYTHGFMLMAIYHLYNFLSQNSSEWKHSLFAAFFFGLSLLSKGPVSLYALLLPFLIAYGSVYRYKEIKKKAWYLVVFLVVGCLLGFWWFVYVRIEDPQTFMSITEKETGNWTSYNVKPFYFYWSFFIQTGIWTIPALLSLFYPYLKNRVLNKKEYTFSLIWTLAAVILLSLIPEKKPRYLFPVLIPLAFNTAFYLEFIIREFVNFKKVSEKLSVYFHFTIIALVAFALPAALFFFKDSFAEVFLIWMLLLSAGSLICSLLLIKSLYKKKMEDSFWVTIGFFAMLLLFGLPFAKNFQSKQPLSELQTELNETRLKTYSFGDHSPELYWAYKKVVPQLAKGTAQSLILPDSLKLIVMEEDISTFKEEFGSKYQIKDLLKIDLNPLDLKGKPDDKKRLICRLYLLNKSDL